ncbi:hypothetical protein ACHAWC_003684 [Mediolabrus comicus]
MENKCSSLEHMLEAKTNSIKEHICSKIDKQHEYNNMLVRNQSWKYSVPVHNSEIYRINDVGYDEDVAEYLSEYSECLKVFTERMRRGEFPSDYSDGRKGIHLKWSEEDPILDGDAISKMSPHWEEFAKALKQFTPAFGVLPDDCETYFALENIQLPGNVPRLLRASLMNKPFQQLSFGYKAYVGDDEGMSVDAIMDIVNSNKHLRKLRIGNNLIGRDDIAKICSVVRHGSIVELDLHNCFENGIGDEMVTSLLTNGDLAKLERLGMASNELHSSTITLLANLLATNPPLQKLGLEDNGLVDNDAEALANALRSNTTLRSLDVFDENTISDAGKEAFRLVLYNDSSLNSIADSNHSCIVAGLYHSADLNMESAVGLYPFGGWNVDGKPESFNRARKIYNLLSQRNKSKSTSNVQHFDDVDVKILPSMLKAAQRYASVVHPYDRFLPGFCRVEPLSIVYEVMRKWDKVFPLYTDGADNDRN